MRATLALGGIWVLLVLWTLFGAWSRAQSADDDLRRLRSDLDVQSLLDGDGTDALGRLSSDSREVANRLDSPVLVPLRFLPVVGRQLRAAEGQADAVADGLEIAQGVGERLQALVPSMGSGPERITALREAEQLAREGRVKMEQLDLGPSNALVGPLHTARTRIDDAHAQAIDALDRAADVSAGLAQFFEGPTDYLLLAANNAQMQNGQGMFLSAGVLHVQDGSVRLEEMEPTSNLPRPSAPVPLDPDLDARWGWLDPNDDFRHLGLSHRFPVTAETAVALWEGAGRPAVDGVLMVDPFLVRAIMTATGPIELGDKELTADTIVTYALHDQYRGYLTGRGDTSFGEQRRDRLQDIAIQAVADFEAVDSVSPALVQSLAVAARGRHLMAWTADPVVQAGWEAARIDGQISPDSLMVSMVNRSGNKLDWFIRSSAVLEVADGPDGMDGTVRVVVENRAPASGEPAYVVGPYPGSDLAAGEYLGLVTVNLPEGATDGRMEGVDPLAVAGADGRNRTIAAWVKVPRGGRTELVVRFQLPAGTSAVRVEASGRARPTSWLAAGETWEDGRSRTVTVPTTP